MTTEINRERVQETERKIAEAIQCINDLGAMVLTYQVQNNIATGFDHIVMSGYSGGWIHVSSVQIPKELTLKDLDPTLEYWGIVRIEEESTPGRNIQLNRLHQPNS